MTSFLLIIMITIMSFSLPLMAQPLSFGLILLISTFLFSLLTAIFASSWYAYMIFLIFIGGLLVMFAYIAALAPNSHFKSLKPSMLFFFSFILYSLLLLSFNFPSPSLFISNHISPFLYFSSSVMYSPSMNPTLFFLLYILLFTMIAVAKICSLYSGPLRPFI